MRFTVEAEDANSEDAARLMGELCIEIKAIYGSDASPFHPEEASLPDGGFVVARVGALAVGCGAFRRMDERAAEIKRIYVAPFARRNKLGRRILAELERLAAERGYETVRLETGVGQPDSIALYESSGYERIPPFGEWEDNSLSVCFEKSLASGD